MILDRSGAPLRSFDTSFTDVIGGTVRDGRYHIAGIGASPILHVLDEQGPPLDIPLAVNVPQNVRASAAFAPTAVLIGWASGTYLVAGYDGQVRMSRVTALAATPASATFPVAAAWDGSEFLLAFSPAVAFRVSSTGEQIGDAFALIADSTGNGLVFGSNGTSRLAVWSDILDSFTRDIVVRPVTTFSALAAAVVPPIVVSYSGEAAGDVQIARNAQGTLLAAWDDADRWLNTSAALDGGAAIPLQSIAGPDYTGWPAVAAGTRVFLVVWHHAALKAGPGRLLAKRFDFSGRDLDPQPIVLTTEATNSSTELMQFSQTPSIVFDGSTFFVVWAEKSDIYVIHLGEDGPIIDTHETGVGQPSFSPPIASARAVWTGSELFVAYGQVAPPNCDLCMPSAFLLAVRFDRSGARITPSPLGLTGFRPSSSLRRVRTMACSANFEPV